MAKICSNCKQEKELQDFNNYKRAKDGKQHYCRDCTKSFKETWRTANKEYVVEYKALWFQQNKEHVENYTQNWRINNVERTAMHTATRKARKFNNGYEDTSEYRLAVKNTETIICPYCGTKIKGTEVHLDHKIPLCRGGGELIENLEPICPTCNLKKNSMTKDEYLQKIGG